MSSEKLKHLLGRMLGVAAESEEEAAKKLPPVLYTAKFEKTIKFEIVEYYPNCRHWKVIRANGSEPVLLVIPNYDRVNKLLLKWAQEKGLTSAEKLCGVTVLAHRNDKLPTAAPRYDWEFFLPCK